MARDMLSLSQVGREHYKSDESYQSLNAGKPNLAQLFPAGTGSISCVKCRTVFSISIQNRLRPGRLDCPFCRARIY